jgi:hypothetical protein
LFHSTDRCSYPTELAPRSSISFVSAAQIFSSRAEVTPLKDSFLLLVFFAHVAVDPYSPSQSMRIVLHTGAQRQDPSVAVHARTPVRSVSTRFFSFCHPVHQAISVLVPLHRGCRSRTRFSPSVSLQLCFSVCSCSSALGVGSAHLRFSLPASAAVCMSILWFHQISAAQGFCSRVSFEPVDQFVFFVLCLLCLGLKVHCRLVLIHLQAPCHP